MLFINTTLNVRIYIIFIFGVRKEVRQQCAKKTDDKLDDKYWKKGYCR